MDRQAISKGRLIALAACASAAVAGLALLRTDALLNTGFTKALDSSRQAWSLAPPSANHTADGDEGYWLTRADVESPTPLAKALAVGDRITIAGQDGRERQLEIVDLKAIGEPLTRVGTGSGPSRLLLVTCRITGAAEGGRDQAPVRFIIEGDTASESGPAHPRAAKAL